MIINIICFVTLYPVLLIMYFAIKKTAVPQNGMAFGSKMKQEWIETSELQKIVDEFKKEMNRILLVAAIVPVASLFVKHVSIQFTIWISWILAIIIALYIPIARANKKVKNLKLEKGWYNSEKKVEYVELRAAGQIRRVKFTTFLLPILLSVLTVLCVYLIPTLSISKELPDALGHVKTFQHTIPIIAAITPVLYMAAVWMDRLKTEVISTNSDVNLNYSRAKKNVWKKFWLFAAWLNTIFAVAMTIVLFLDKGFASLLVWGSAAICGIMLLSCVPLFKKLRSIEEAYEKEKNIWGHEDDDANWYFGMLYYNPRDKHSMVTTRIGIGTTVNYASTFGKVMAIIAVIACISMPITSIWMILEEFTPIQLSVEDDVVKAEHLKVDYKLPLEDIVEVEVLQELPRWTKSSGSAMDNLQKGTFYIRNEGKCQVHLNPQNGMFLKIVTEEEEYYFSGVTDEETMHVYELMKQ